MGGQSTSQPGINSFTKRCDCAMCRDVFKFLPCIHSRVSMEKEISFKKILHHVILKITKKINLHFCSICAWLIMPPGACIPAPMPDSCPKGPPNCPYPPMLPIPPPAPPPIRPPLGKPGTSLMISKPGSSDFVFSKL